MLQRRLTGALLLTLAATTLIACGDKPIEDNLVRPGITAIEQSRDLACGADAATIRAAIDAYTVLNGGPPADEAALVDARLLRSVSEGWDVVDGSLVAQHPSCGPVGDSTPEPSTVDIVTDPLPVSPEQILAGMSADQIDIVGGVDCARELVSILAASEEYVAEQQAEPTGFDDLVDGGYLDEPPTRWALDGDRFIAADGSGCVGPPG